MFVKVSMLILLTIAAFLNTQALLRTSYNYKNYPTPKLQALSSETLAPTEVELVDQITSGCVLVAKPTEFNHFMVSAVVLIFRHDDTGSEGVILERPTAFTMGETAPGIGVFEANTLFMGGENGNDMALMFHKFDLGGACKSIGYGLYLGGLRQATQLVESRQAHPKDFKFVFNQSVWAKGLLEKEIAEHRWDVLKCPPDMLIRQTDQPLWFRCRQELRKLGRIKESESDDEEVIM